MSKSRSKSKDLAVKGTQPSLKKKPETPLDPFTLKNELNQVLPPLLFGGPTYGRLFIEIQNLHSLEYNKRDYMQVEENDVYVNFKFWGEQGRGVFLRVSSS